MRREEGRRNNRTFLLRANIKNSAFLVKRKLINCGKPQSQIDIVRNRENISFFANAEPAKSLKKIDNDDNTVSHNVIITCHPLTDVFSAGDIFTRFNVN